MAGVRALLMKESERTRIPAYVSSIACVEPKLGTEKECAELPHIILEAIATESMRLTNPQEPTEEEDDGKKA